MLKLTNEINNLSIIAELLRNSSAAFEDDLKLVVIDAVAKSEVEVDIHKTRAWLTNFVFEYFSGLRITTGKSSSTYYYLTSKSEDLDELHRKLKQAQRKTFESAVITKVIEINSGSDATSVALLMTDALNTKGIFEGRKSFSILCEKLPPIFPKRKRA